MLWIREPLDDRIPGAINAVAIEEYRVHRWDLEMRRDQGSRDRREEKMMELTARVWDDDGDGERRREAPIVKRGATALEVELREMRTTPDHRSMAVALPRDQEAATLLEIYILFLEDLIAVNIPVIVCFLLF